MNAAPKVLLPSLFALLVACGPDASDAGFDFDKPDQGPHRACVYQSKTSLSCVGSDGSPGEWTTQCIEDSDCSTVSGDSDIFDDCSSTTLVQGAHVVDGTCAEATAKASSSSSSSPSSSSSSSSSGGAPTIVAPAAGDGAAKCRELVSRLCGRFAGCDSSVDATECEATGESKLDCKSSTGVSSSYSTCLADLDAASCSSFASGIPTSCNAVILR